LGRCCPDLGFHAVDVAAQASSPNTIGYYYTYGAVLPALTRLRDNECENAIGIFDEVTTELNANPDAYADGRETNVSIVQAGEDMCESLASGEPIRTSGDESATAAPALEEAMIDVTATPTP